MTGTQTQAPKTQAQIKKELGVEQLVRGYLAQFTDRDAAFRWAARGPEYGFVMHGTNGLFWVVSAGDCDRLEKSGVERAPRLPGDPIFRG